MLYFSRWKTILIWLTVLLAVIFAIPNILTPSMRASLPDFVPSKPMTLGLDLQGGSHMLLQIDRKELIDERMQTLRDDVRRSLRDERIGYTGLSIIDRTVSVTIRDLAELGNAQEALSVLSEPVSTSLFSGGTINEVDFVASEDGKISVTFTEDGIDYRLRTALEQTIEVVARRINELGTTEPLVQSQGVDRILVQVPGLDDPERLKALLGQTAKLNFRFVDRTMPVLEAMNGRPPAGTEVLPSVEAEGENYIVETQVIVAGENLSDAQAGFDQRTNEPIVTFRFDTKGAQRFGQATQRNVNREFAIVLDNQVISAPVIREPILGGSGQISGNFTTESANDLAILLRAGALPATLTIIEERTVGPGLGADSIAAGETASVIGGILVIIFMMLAYGRFGLIANLALVVNVAMVIAALSILGATLTLPGIAGIVLTIGMAVDSNVLIFERIREEMRGGRSVIQSIDAGFSRALSTIIDANVTTLIAAIILFYLGTGPVRGFAVTLAIGILTTMFTAFTLTRWLVADWVRRKKPKDLPNGYMTLIPDGTHIPFMWLRRVTFSVSSVMVVVALVLFGTINMNFGIDFKGGSLIEVQSKEGPADIADIRARLSNLNLGDLQVQEFGGEQDVLIRVETQGAGETGEQTIVTKVRDELSDNYEFRRVEVVGPTISGELARAGTIAVIASLLAILVYIWLRFEWQFALGAVLATAHDVVMTIGLYVITGLEFNLSSIAAVLTIVGYSLNDTVVVYDRVRENLRRYKKMDLPELLDLSMNQTLSRTVLTALTTLLALIALFIFGGEVIRSFTAAMIFGIVIGTYSSIFIAAPLLIMFGLRPDQTRYQNPPKGDGVPENSVPIQLDD